MSVNYFKHQDNVRVNTILYMRERGFSRLTLSKLTDIPRPVLDQLLSLWTEDESEYNSFIQKIQSRFGLTTDYLLRTSELPQPSETKLSPLAQECYLGMHIIMDIFSMYLKPK